MAQVGLLGTINAGLLGRFTAAANSSSSSGQSVVSALNGSGASAATTQATSLRLGARTYATAVQGINSLIAFTNLTRQSLEKLDKITDKLITVTEKAASGATGVEKRKQLDAEFRELGKDFMEIVDSSKNGDNNYLTKEGLSNIFKVVGLDPESSDTMAEVFKTFVVSSKDDYLASETEKGQRPVPIPPSALTDTAPGAAKYDRTEYDDIFDSLRNIRSRPNAYKMTVDLKALKHQIETNTKRLDDVTALLGKNLELVRAAGFGLLDMSNSITKVETAEQLAGELRARIQKDAPAALSQAANLDPIAVAILALSSGSSSASTTKSSSGG